MTTNHIQCAMVLRSNGHSLPSIRSKPHKKSGKTYNMTILETVLRGANGIQYLECFEREEINPRLLKLLSDEDLQMIGVDDANVRNEIIKHSQTLLCATETKVDTKINEDYINTTLAQLVLQINVYNALLTCLARRTDIINCDINVANDSYALKKTLKELHSEVVRFKEKLLKTHDKPDKPLDDSNPEDNGISAKQVFQRVCVIGIIAVANFIIVRKLSKWF